VVTLVGLRSLRLQACKVDGTLEQQVVEFDWATVTEWEADDEALAFCFKYHKPDKDPKWVKIQTPYVSGKILNTHIQVIPQNSDDSNQSD